MKKIVKNRIFIFITTAILFTSLGVYGATKYKASEILYNASNGDSITVNDALNSLYSMKSELNNLKGVGDAAASQVLTGKIVMVKGNKITGTMPNKGNLNWNPSSSTTYTIPTGYYSGGTISTVNSYNAGYNKGLDSGQKSATVVVHVYGVGGSAEEVGNKTYTLSYPNTGGYSQGDGDTKVEISWK